MAIEERDVEFYQTYQKATPGQSLTNSPNSKYAWEEAPLYTNRHEAEVFILEQLTEELKRLQSIVDTPPKTEEELDWHLKPPMPTGEIQDLYEKYMKHSYDSEDYKDK